MRVRFRFAKHGKVRFTSHRDVARIWERALRRVQLPVAYSEGFSPRPRVSFGLALPTGYESLGEYLDVDLLQPVDVVALPARLDPALPVGFDVQGTTVVEPGTPSLQQAVVTCTWRLEVSGIEPHVAQGAVDAALAADQLVLTRTRKGAAVTDDVRPGILSLAVIGPAGTGTELEAELATQPRGLRPSELLAAVFGAEVEEARGCRTHQWISVDGARREPIELAASATPTAHAMGRAS